ncbi:MAG: hypothetical protein R2686_06255 [Candidatus Nanopelagicales bacterium]
MLSASAIMLSGRVDPVRCAVVLLPAVLPLLLPLAVIAVPLLDVGMAVVRRTRRGRSPFAPDKEHLHHRLIELGHSHRRVFVGLMHAWTTLIVLGRSSRPDSSLGAGRVPDRSGRAGADGVAAGGHPYRGGDASMGRE